MKNDYGCWHGKRGDEGTKITDKVYKGGVSEVNKGGVSEVDMSSLKSRINNTFFHWQTFLLQVDNGNFTTNPNHRGEVLFGNCITENLSQYVMEKLMQTNCSEVGYVNK